MSGTNLVSRGSPGALQKKTIADCLFLKEVPSVLRELTLSIGLSVMELLFPESCAVQMIFLPCSRSK
jgi:hypothetical protein